jgi:hypothetical protein
MLHRNMNAPLSLRLGLDDLLADLQHARRQGDLGRLALVACFDVRRWARQAGENGIAARSAAIFTHPPHASREAFLEQVDTLVHDLEMVQARLPQMPPSRMAPLMVSGTGVSAISH